MIKYPYKRFVDIICIHTQTQLVKVHKRHTTMGENMLINIINAIKDDDV